MLSISSGLIFQESVPKGTPSITIKGSFPRKYNFGAVKNSADEATTKPETFPANEFITLGSLAFVKSPSTS